MHRNLDFQDWLLRARGIVSTCRVEVSHAPVLASVGMFLASVQHRQRLVTVNGWALDREAGTDLIKRAQIQAKWIAHEVFHLLCREFPELEGLVNGHEETLADEFAEAVWADLQIKVSTT